MGLLWTETTPGREWVGAGVDELRYATVSEGAGGYAVYLEPRGCPHEGGLWLEGAPVWASAGDAMEAADRYVVAHVDRRPAGITAPSDDRPPPEDGPRSMRNAGWR